MAVGTSNRFGTEPAFEPCATSGNRSGAPSDAWGWLDAYTIGSGHN